MRIPIGSNPEWETRSGEHSCLGSLLPLERLFEINLKNNQLLFEVERVKSQSFEWEMCFSPCPTRNYEDWWTTVKVYWKVMIVQVGVKWGAHKIKPGGMVDAKLPLGDQKHIQSSEAHF